MSHHKSVGSSSEGEMSIKQESLDFWISRKCCIEILQTQQNISLPLLQCGNHKANLWLSSPNTFPIAVPLPVVWFHPKYMVS